MAAYNKFDQFIEDLARKVHDLNSDVLKVYLTNALPVRGNKVKADVAEIAGGNGYTAGGNIVPFLSGGQVNGLYRLMLADPASWLAVGGSIGPFRAAVLYNSSVGSNPLISWWNYGASITLNDGEEFIADMDTTNGTVILQ